MPSGLKSESPEIFWRLVCERSSATCEGSHFLGYVYHGGTHNDVEQFRKRLHSKWNEELGKKSFMTFTELHQGAQSLMTAVSKRGRQLAPLSLVSLHPVSLARLPPLKSVIFGTSCEC